MAANAKVWTDPATQVVETDSAGYWEINTGLVPGHYDVRAELEGVEGRARQVTTQLGKTERVVILLGEQDMSWPPSISIEDRLPTGSKGPGPVRCCD